MRGRVAISYLFGNQKFLFDPSKTTVTFPKDIRELIQKIPEELVKKMKANFYMPKADDGVFNKIRHLELEEEKATSLVEQYNSEFKDYVCSGWFSENFFTLAPRIVHELVRLAHI